MMTGKKSAYPKPTPSGLLFACGATIRDLYSCVYASSDHPRTQNVDRDIANVLSCSGVSLSHSCRSGTRFGCVI
jgi:hypothetical protein